MQELNLQLLAESGAFVKPELVKQEIDWESNDGTKQKNIVFVKRASFESVMNEFAGQDVKDLASLEHYKDTVSKRIAFFITDKDGKPVFSKEDVLGSNERGALNESLTLALLAAIAMANSVGKNPASPTKKKSGTS